MTAIPAVSPRISAVSPRLIAAVFDDPAALLLASAKELAWRWGSCERGTERGEWAADIPAVRDAIGVLAGLFAPGDGPAAGPMNASTARYGSGSVLGTAAEMADTAGGSLREAARFLTETTAS